MVIFNEGQREWWISRFYIQIPKILLFPKKNYLCYVAATRGYYWKLFSRTMEFRINKIPSFHIGCHYLSSNEERSNLASHPRLTQTFRERTHNFNFSLWGCRQGWPMLFHRSCTISESSGKNTRKHIIYSLLTVLFRFSNLIKKIINIFKAL